MRITAYIFLLRDEYPSVDDEQAVHVEVLYPDAPNSLNRWLPLVKWFLAIHYIVLAFLNIAAVVVVIIAWFAILFTGRYPRGMFDFVTGVVRWSCASRRARSCSSPTGTRRSASRPGAHTTGVANVLHAVDTGRNGAAARPSAAPLS